MLFLTANQRTEMEGSHERCDRENIYQCAEQM